MQANNIRERSSQSHWLNIIESAAVVAAIGGSVASVVLNQIALATFVQNRAYFGGELHLPRRQNRMYFGGELPNFGTLVLLLHRPSF